MEVIQLSLIHILIEEPKTDKGIRYVPMTETVAACFRRIIANRKTPKVEPMVEGYAGFLFLDKNDMPMVALHWEKYLEPVSYTHLFRGGTTPGRTGELTPK